MESKPPTGASVLACAPKSGTKLPLPCPDWPYLPSLVLRAPYQSPTDLACAQLALLCPIGGQGKSGVPSPRVHHWGCVKSHFLCYKSTLGARMASLQNDFFDFLGLFAQPLACRAPSQELLTLLWGCAKSHSPY